MKNNPRLNGSDYLMLGFDYELRSRDFAGNSCQIVLELAGTVSPDALERRVAGLVNSFPILRARPGGVIQPKWKHSGSAGSGPRVRTHRAESGLCQNIFNEPLATKRGELVRFDLINRDDGRADLIFTWAHSLMDAAAAEQFLAIVGNEDLGLPEMTALPARTNLKWPQRLELMKKSVAQLDQFCEARPRSMGVRQPQAPRHLRYRVEKFSATETAGIRAHSSRLCGVLGDAQFHAAVSALELHQLHQRLGCPSGSYILPMPVGLRPKGRMVSLFGNQVDMLMLQFLPDHVGTIEKAVAALKTQTAQALRDNSLQNSRVLSETFSFLPLPVYMAVLKHGLRGEICSLFFGDTAAVNPALTNFQGVAIEDFAHVAAVTPKPGIGVVFYYFRGQLRVTVVYATTVLSEAEAGEFAAALRARLLNP